MSGSFTFWFRLERVPRAVLRSTAFPLPGKAENRVVLFEVFDSQPMLWITAPGCCQPFSRQNDCFKSAHSCVPDSRRCYHGKQRASVSVPDSTKLSKFCVVCGLNMNEITPEDVSSLLSQRATCFSPCGELRAAEGWSTTTIAAPIVQAAVLFSKDQVSRGVHRETEPLAEKRVHRCTDSGVQHRVPTLHVSKYEHSRLGVQLSTTV